MKRIALFGLVCFALSGYGDDSGGKVTNDFLVGKWGCTNKEYKSEYDSKFEEYSDYVESSSKQIIQSYKVVNGVLLSKTADKEALEFDLDKFYNNLTTTGKIDNECQHVINKNFSKNSANQFTIEMETLFDCSDKQKFKTKRESVCTRIK